MKNGFGISGLIIFILTILLFSCNNENVPTVTTSAVTNITTETASSGGTIVFIKSGKIISKGVCWSTGNSPTVADTKTVDGGGFGNFSSDITGLNQATVYYVRAYATNSAGTGYGMPISFTTSSSTVADEDGNIYKTVIIGDQIWMAENLKTTKYNDGTSIPLVTNNEEWSKLTTPSYCWYNNDEATYKNTYGALYNWNTVNTGKLCPAGWHVPTDTDWITLTTNVAGEGGKLKESDTTHWTTPNKGATNETGFTALPGGVRYGGGKYVSIKDYGYWWSSTEASALYAWDMYLNYNLSSVNRIDDDKTLALSVRCVKDSVDESVKVSANAENNSVETDTVKKNTTLSVISGVYKNGLLFLAFDGENVTGFYSNGKYQGNPNFGCSFYFFGSISDKIEDRMIKIKALNPFNLSKQPRDGTFKLHDEEDDIFSLVANLDTEDCWDPQLGLSEIGTPPGTGFELTEKKDWLEIRIANSEKVYFYNEKDESTIRTTYVTKGDPLLISEQDGEWLKVTFMGSKSETTGWIKKADTKSFMEI